MINENINHKFENTLKGLMAFIADLELKFQQYITDLPVFVQDSGDSSVYLTKKFENTDNKEIIQKIPRLVIKIEENIELNKEDLTNQYNRYNFIYNDKIYSTVGRRLPLFINVNIFFVSSSYVKHLEHTEIFFNLMSRPNSFTFEFEGNTYEGAYEINSDSSERPSMDVGSNSRNYVKSGQIQLQLHILSPRIETIIENSNQNINAFKTLFDINILNDLGIIEKTDILDTSI